MNRASKKIVKWIIIMAMVLIMMGSFLLQYINNHKNDVVEIHILSSSDTHGYMLLDNEHTIHYDQLAAYKYELEAKGKHVILLDAGNAIQGSLVTNLSRGSSTIQLMNHVGYNAINIGYHDFIFGSQRWLELQDLADFPIISSNVAWKNMPGIITAYEIIDVEGVKLAIVGVTSSKAKKTVSEDKVAEIEVINPMKILSPLIEQVTLESDIIIVMASLGGQSPDLAIQLARTFPEILIIMDSDYVTKDANGEEVNSTLIINNLRHAKTINDTHFKIKNGEIMEMSNKRLTSDTLVISSKMEKDGRVVNINKFIQSFQSDLDRSFNQVIFVNPVFLDGEKLKVRTAESNLGYLIADSFRVMSGSDVAFINGGSLRGSLPAGNISYESIFSVMPYANDIVTIELTGAQIKEALEYGLSQYPQDFSGFLHVSGLIYNYDMSYGVGERVSDVWINDTPLNLAKTYTVAITTFLLNGGDGYDVFKQPTVQTFDSDINIFIAYMTSYADEIFEEIAFPRSLAKLSLSLAE